jgi:hypothetical protein
MGLEALGAQQLDRLDGHHAVGPAAVGDDLAALRQLLEAGLELADGDGERPGMWPARNSSTGRTSSTVTSPRLTRRESSSLRPPARRAALEVGAGDLLDLGEARLGEAAQRDEEPAHLVVGEAVLDVEALLLGLDEPRRPEHLQVLRGVGHRDGGLLGERLDGARALAQQVEQLDALGRRGGLPDAGELLVDASLKRRCGVVRR